jgi:hypothetical protein
MIDVFLVLWWVFKTVFGIVLGLVFLYTYSLLCFCYGAVILKNFRIDLFSFDLDDPVEVAKQPKFWIGFLVGFSAFIGLGMWVTNDRFQDNYGLVGVAVVAVVFLSPFLLAKYTWIDPKQ